MVSDVCFGQVMRQIMSCPCPIVNVWLLLPAETRHPITAGLAEDRDKGRDFGDLESEDDQESLESVDSPENLGFTEIVVLLGLRGSRG